MFDIGGPELILILVGVLILFGPKKLPELAQGLGKGLRQFRKAQQEFNDQITSAMREEERKKNDEWKRPIEPQTVARGNGQKKPAGPALPDGSPPLDDMTGTDEESVENRIAPPPPPPTDEQPEESAVKEEKKSSEGSKGEETV